MKKIALFALALLAFTGATAPFGREGGVTIEEIETGNRVIRGVATGIPVLVGYTESVAGPMTVGSMNDYQKAFGGPAGRGARYALYESVKLFFDNGGVTCVVISAGLYGQAPDYRALCNALQSSRDVSASIVCVPDAVYLPAADFFRLQNDLCTLCREKRDRFAVLDTQQPSGSASIDARNYRPLIPGTSASWGAAYYPWLVMEGGKQVPPCGAIAGIYSAADESRGVWKAPANIPVRGVTGPSVALTASQQDMLQAGTGTGISINAIRTLPGREKGKSPFVCNARTLPRNDPEWRYVQVRRLMIYLEQSIIAGLRWVAKEPNDAVTWTAVREAVSRFLAEEWRNGAMPGSLPGEAYFVRVGLGKTMTADDITKGMMIVETGFAAVRPAEFVILRTAIPMAPR